MGQMYTHLATVSLRVCVCVCRLILRGNRQSALQPEHDLESENTRQETKCVTWAQSFSHSPRDTDSGGPERERDGETEERQRELLLPTGCTQELIKSFEIDTQGTCTQSSRGKGLMRLRKGRGLT